MVLWFACVYPVCVILRPKISVMQLLRILYVYSHRLVPQHHAIHLVDVCTHNFPAFVTFMYIRKCWPNWLKTTWLVHADNVLIHFHIIALLGYQTQLVRLYHSERLSELLWYFPPTMAIEQRLFRHSLLQSFSFSISTSQTTCFHIFL